MGIYYYALDHSAKKFFRSPKEFSMKSPGIFHPENPFPGMLVMKNIQGYDFQIYDDCSYDIPPNNEWTDITEEVYKEYKQTWYEKSQEYKT